MLALAAFVLLQATQDDVIRGLVDDLGSDKIQARNEALEKLEKIGRQAIPALTRASRDPDVEISSRARAALDRMAVRESLTPSIVKFAPEIESRLLMGKWREVFIEMAADFRLIDGQRRYAGVRAEDLSGMAAMAVPRARTDTERVQVCEAVGRLKLKSAFPALLDYLKDEMPTVRMSALSAARDADARDHAAALRPSLEDAHPGVRSVAAHAMGLMADLESIPVLRKMLQDPVSNVRWWAVRALGDLGAVEARADVRKLLQDSDDTVHRAAQEVLQRLDRKP